MPIFTTEGVIVKRFNLGEADRLLTIITPYRGKIKVLAKGVRRITSRRGGNVELLNKVRLQIFQGKSLKILTEAEALKTFPKLKNDLILSTYASHIAELEERLLPEEQPNRGAYNLLTTILTLLEKNPRQIFIRAFEVKLLTILGFWSLGQIKASQDIKEVLKSLENKTFEGIALMKITQKQALEVERILRYYIERVLESSLRSMKIMEKLKVINNK